MQEVNWTFIFCYKRYFWKQVASLWDQIDLTAASRTNARIWAYIIGQRQMHEKVFKTGHTRTSSGLKGVCQSPIEQSCVKKSSDCSCALRNQLTRLEENNLEQCLLISSFWLTFLFVERLVKRWEQRSSVKRTSRIV